MDITLNEDQQRLLDTARAFAREALTPDRIRALEETENGFDPSVWRAMAEMGWLGGAFPEEYGGFGVEFVEIALIVEALGQGALPSPFFSTVIEAGLLLTDAGSDAQKAAYLPRIAAGDVILTTAILEPSGSLEAAAVQTRISASGANLVLNGTKLFVRDAGAAEALIVLGRSGSAETELTLAMVPTQSAGLSMRHLAAAGGEALWEVVFDNVVVEDSGIVGGWNQAWPHVLRLLRRGAAFKACELVGIGQASLDLTLAYAKIRVQFDKPIGSFQAVQHHCADMHRDVEICRLLTWQAVAAMESSDAVREIALAKAKCSTVIPAVTRLAHQVHGAIAYYRSYPLELYYNRAVAAKAAYGDALYHRRILANMLRTDLDTFRGDRRHDLPVYHG